MARLVVPLRDFEEVRSCDQFWVVLEVVVNPVGENVGREERLSPRTDRDADIVARLGQPLARDEKDDDGVTGILSHGFSFFLQVSAQQLAFWWSQTLEDLELGVLRVPVSYRIPHIENQVTNEEGGGKNEDDLHGSTEVRITFVRRVPRDHKLWEKPEKSRSKEEAKPRLRRLLDKLTEFREPVHCGSSFLAEVLAPASDGKEEA